MTQFRCDVFPCSSFCVKLGAKTSYLHDLKYLYEHSSSDTEIDGRGPGRGEKANEEAFEDDGSMKRQAILFHRHLIVMSEIIEYNN